MNLKEQRRLARYYDSYPILIEFIKYVQQHNIDSPEYDLDLSILAKQTLAEWDRRRGDT